MPPPPPSPGYVARFGVDRRTGLVLAGCAAFTAACLGLPAGDPGMWVVKVLGLLLFGAGGAWFLSMALRGGLAFRADAEGVTLGSPRIRQPAMHNRPLHVPWTDVAEVVLFHQYAGLASVPYVGLRLRPGARCPTTFDHRSRLWRLNRGLFPHVPDAVLVRSRPVTGWHLDERRLLQAVTTFAPEVRVLHLDRDGSIQPLTG